MTKRFFAAFAAAMMAMATMNAGNTNGGNNTETQQMMGQMATQKVSIEVTGMDNNKYVYRLDEMGRVESRVSYKQSKMSGEWVPVAAYTVFFGEKENVLTYAEYNAENHVFNLHAKQQKFNSKDYPELIKVPNVNVE